MFRIVGLGGTAKEASSTELALEIALKHVRGADMTVRQFDGAFLARLPFYGTCEASGDKNARLLIEAIREADGILIASPGYHGSISGLVKNALDHLEDTSRDIRIYLDGLPVGLIVTAYGSQATGSTIMALRSIVHALRAWPTPFGATIVSRPGLFLSGKCSDPVVEEQLALVGHQLARYARLHAEDRRNVAGQASVGEPAQ